MLSCTRLRGGPQPGSCFASWTTVARRRAEGRFEGQLVQEKSRPWAAYPSESSGAIRAI